VETSAINRRVLESLIQAGACDCLEGDRAQLLEAVGDLLTQAQDRARGVSQSQESLFGSDHGVLTQELPLPATPPWTLEERLRRERDVLGFYFSDHPLAAYRGQMAARATGDTAGLGDLRDGAEATLIGLVAGVKSHTDRNKRPMAFVTLEDMKGTVETTIFADLYERCRADLRPGAIVEVRGKVNQREDAEPKMVLSSVRRLGGAGSDAPRAVHIDLSGPGAPVSLEEIRELLVRHPGESPVYFIVGGADGPGATRIIAKRILVQPNDELLRALRERLGERAVRVANGHAEAVPF
jgi:DNA polymerase-3 subunit alpha